MAFAVLSTELVHVHWPPGLWLGAAGGSAYALGRFLADYREGFPDGRPDGMYLVAVAARVILGAIVGVVALALGGDAAFVAGLGGPEVLVGFGAKFGRRKQRPPGGKEAASDATDRPNAKPRT